VRRGLMHLSERLGVIGLSYAWGGMGERAVLDAANVYAVPEALTDLQAAMIEPGAVALYAVDRGQVRAGSSVLISGVGPIGALVLLAARAAGASAIFVSEPNAFRRSKAKELVPDIIAIDPRTEDVASVVRAHTEDGVGCDVALECVGNEKSLDACTVAVRRQGTIVQVGLHVGRASVDAMLWALKDITLEATWCFPVQSWPRVASLIAAGLYPVEKIITADIAAEDVVEKGFEALLDPAGQNLKIIVRA
jgi:(R,R)-butanediol dehydrogenase/meso-butanediol dehydrogenase/diacetyl reductase